MLIFKLKTQKIRLKNKRKNNSKNISQKTPIVLSTVRETQDYEPLQRQARIKQPNKLSQLPDTQLNLLTLTFLAILNVNSDKLVLINRR